MANKQIEMRKVKKIFQLYTEGLSKRKIRSYIFGRQKLLTKGNKNKEEMLNWLKWTNDKADWFDPLIEKEDLILKNFDPQILNTK